MTEAAAASTLPHVRRPTPPAVYTATDAPFAGTVLLVAPWYGGTGGGVAVSSETLAGALLRARVRVVVLSLHPPANGAGRGRFGEEQATVRLYGADVRRRGPKGWAGYHVRALLAGLAVRRLVKRHDVRVAHLNYAMPEYAPLIAWLRRLGVPVVLTFRGSDVHNLPSTPETDAGLSSDLNAVVAAAARVTAVSEGLLRSALQRLPAARGKAQAVSNVAPLDLWDAARDATIDAPREVDLLFVGNLRSVKGPDFLLEAMADVVRRRPATSLAIVGTGEMESELREAIERLGLQANVRFEGRVSREDMPGHFRRARMLVVPSRAEGMPVAAVEAQLYGTPVVGTAVGGVPEVVRDGETGAIVPFGDATGFAAAILALLDDDDAWRRASAAARAWATSAFDPANAAARYVAIYRDVTGSAPAEPSVAGAEYRPDHAAATAAAGT